MKIEEIRTRIQKKEEQITKLFASYKKSAQEISDEERAIISRFLESGNRDEYRAWLKANNRFYGGDAWSKANDLYDARNCLTKYHQQLENEIAKKNTLNAIPEVIKLFGQELLERWNRYDLWKKQQIREEYRAYQEKRDIEYKEFSYNMRNKWGRDYYEFAYYTTDEQIIKNNEKAVDNLILNLVSRTVEIAGTIIDAQYLRLDRDNNGYAIINGIVIGEKGKAKVESIGAGGYNIQRYHIRVLVKEVK